MSSQRYRRQRSNTTESSIATLSSTSLLAPSRARRTRSRGCRSLLRIRPRFRKSPCLLQSNGGVTMLEHLGGREFEEYCQVLLTCLYGCRVELTKRTGDEGRDLLVRKPCGLEVVECKHWPDRTVGRPAVQKLHSAVLTANSRQGAIITTGRFSKEAEVYAKNLGDVRIELIDASKLAHMISLTFPNDALPLNLCSAIKTTSDVDFPKVFFQSVFSESRYQSSRAGSMPVFVTRVTEYKTFFIANYHAGGSVSTAVGEYSATWDGSVWCSALGDNAGFGSPSSHRHKLGPVVPLADVVRTVPGKSAPPRLQPYQAVARMKDYIVSHCSKAVWYRGRNNVNYSATIQPSASKVLIDSLALVYVPRQEFVLEIGGVRYEGQVEESESPPQFHLTCPQLSECSVCGTATSADDQILCSICLRPAHRWGLFTPDSFRCERCGDFVCRTHAVRIGKQLACCRCGTGGSSLDPPWRHHRLFGIAGFACATLATVLTPICCLQGGWDMTNPTTWAVSAIGVLLGLGAWTPFLWMIVRASVIHKHERLTYPKQEVHAQPTRKPDWLYGNRS